MHTNPPLDPEPPWWGGKLRVDLGGGNPSKQQLHLQIHLALREEKCSKSKFWVPQEAAAAVGWEWDAQMCSGIQEPPFGTGGEPRGSWIIPKLPPQSTLASQDFLPAPSLSVLPQILSFPLHPQPQLWPKPSGSLGSTPPRQTL